MIEQVKQIVREASEIIKRAGDIAENTMAKEGTANYVTKYDLEVQKFLMKRLSETFEGCHFIGEEAGCDENPVARGLTFIIDPIDGTTNFICRFQYSAISVGVVLDGEIVGGVVYNPYRGEMFWAEKGRGAYLNDTRLQPQDGPLSSSVVIFKFLQLPGTSFTRRPARSNSMQSSVICPLSGPSPNARCSASSSSR